MRKPTCKNKAADQQCSDCTADQCLYFCYTKCITALFLNPKFQASRYFTRLYRPVVSDLVGNPEDQFSCAKAKKMLYLNNKRYCTLLPVHCLSLLDCQLYSDLRPSPSHLTLAHLEYLALMLKVGMDKMNNFL